MKNKSPYASLIDPLPLKLVSVHGTYRLDGKERAVPIESANRFFEAMEARGLSIRTTRAYGYDLLHLFRWLIKIERRFESVTHREFLEYIKFQRKENAAPASINRRLVSAEMFYRFCYRKVVPGSNEVSYPATYFRSVGYDRARGIFPIKKSIRRTLRVNQPQRLVQGLDPTEIAEFFKKVQRHRDVAMVLCMLMCGLRRCEIIGLRMDGVNLGARTLRVVGKGNRERVVPLPSPIINAMIKYLKFERPGMTDDPHFFVTLQGPRRGKAFLPAGFDGLFRYKRHATNILRANPHRFRHTFGRDMASHGVSLPVLQRMMGHADATTTLKYINLCMTDILQDYQQAQEKMKKRYGRL